MLFDWPSRFWAVGPSVTLPLFQGGQLNARFARQRPFMRKPSPSTAKRYSPLLLKWKTILRPSIFWPMNIEKVLDALQSVRRQQEIAGNRYRSGLATYLEVATAQNAALGIERSSVRLRGQQLVSVAALDQIARRWMAGDGYR